MPGIRIFLLFDRMVSPELRFMRGFWEWRGWNQSLDLDSPNTYPQPNLAPRGRRSLDEALAHEIGMVVRPGKIGIHATHPGLRINRVWARLGKLDHDTADVGSGID